MANTLTLKSGDLAYYDSFAGLITVRVVSIAGESGSAGTAQRIKVRFTCKTGLYGFGETLETYGMHVVPRKAVRRYSGKRARIMNYRVEVDGV